MGRTVSIPGDGSRAHRAHPLRKRRIRICREGAIYLVICLVVLLGSILRDVNLLLVLASMMIGPFLFNGLVASVMVRSVRVGRQIPPQIPSHQAWHGTYHVDNSIGRSPVWTLVLQDTIYRSRGARAGRMEAFVLHVARRTSGVTSFRGPALPRGKYFCANLTITTRFPFGLVSASSTTQEHKEFLVVPRLGLLETNWVTWLRQAQLGFRGGHRRGRSDGEFHAMRDWRAGDSRNSIHWRTTARRNELTVRELETPDSKELVVLVDLCASNTAPATLNTDIERMVSFVATLITKYNSRSGTSILLGLAGYDDSVLQGAVSQRFLDEVMQQLALAEPAATSTLSRLIPKVMGRVSRDAFVLLVGRAPAEARSLRESQFLARCTFVPVIAPEFHSVFVLPDLPATPARTETIP